MANDVILDASDFERGLDRLEKQVDMLKSKAVLDMANEALRLSQEQVPHDTGYLQNTGVAELESLDEAVVGYNTPYAARLHEHPEYNFQKGRKGKYLEDPVKQNLTKFAEFFQRTLEGAMR